MEFKEEWKIRRMLRKFSKQRVALVLPNNTWVIENAVGDTEETDTALKTCYIRG